MAERHICMLKSFASKNALEGSRDSTSVKANRWDAATKALKLLMLLEGEALATWLDLSKDEQGNYETAKEKLTGKLMPAPFMMLDKFHQCKSCRCLSTT